MYLVTHNFILVYMYKKYTTDAIILDTYDHGEADRSFRLFTEDFGVIFATARSVRKVESKLRFGLQKYAQSEISLVYGKGGWRITGAHPHFNVFTELHGHKRRLVVFFRFIRLLTRLVRGQQPDRRLFRLVAEAVGQLCDTGFDDRYLKELEVITVVRILHRLGYIGESSWLEDIITDRVASDHALAAARKHRREVVRTINKSLRDSQL